MVYRAVGLMSGSSLDGLDIVYSHLEETGGKWAYEIVQSACYKYSPEWIQKLKTATSLSALDYQLLHTEFGHYIGKQVNLFIQENDLHYKVQLIASHGHTSFHVPAKKMTAQLGDGAAVAAATGIHVISDLRSMDLALGGQGAPIVPIGEKLLFGDYDLFLNIGGIANISYKQPDQYIAFDVCAANKVLNMLAAESGKEYDEDGKMAASGTIDSALLEKLNAFPYYGNPYPKSLANDFGIDTIYPLVSSAGCGLQNAMRTYVEHICLQIKNAVELAIRSDNTVARATGFRLLVTGGGAHNIFLMNRLKELLQKISVETIIPDAHLVNYKEALIMALIGVLRWREENNVLASVTGASRDSVGGTVWLGNPQ